MASVDSPASPARDLRPYPLVLAALVAAEATGAFEASMLISAVPKLIAEFHLKATDVGWAFTGFLLMSAAAAAIGGKLGDLFGRKKVLLIVLLLSIVGSLVSVTVGTFPAIVLGRTIQGVSGAVLPLIMGISREAVAPKRVPVTMAVVAGTVTVAGAFGYWAAGQLVEHFSWHGIFIVAGALAVVATVLCHFALNPSPKNHVKGEKVDVIGGVLFVPALAAILYGVTSSQTKGWSSAVVLGCIAAGTFIGAFWVWWELRVAQPMINLRLLGRPKYTLTMGIVACLAFGVMGGMQLVQPLLFQSPENAPVGLGMSPSAFGDMGLAISVVVFLAAPLSGMLAGRFGAKRPMLVGVVALTAFMPCYYLLRENLPLLVAVLILTGLGTTFVLTSIPTLLAEVVPTGNMGEAMGFAVVIRSLLQAVGISVFSVALSSSVVPGTQFPQLGAFGLTIALASAGAVAGLALTLLVRGGVRPPVKTAEAEAAPIMAPE
jgi:MFS family permease